MTSLPSLGRRKIPASQAIESIAASTILICRLLVGGSVPPWRDWILILAVYWIFTAWAGRTRSWLPVTVSVMALLSAISFFGQIPHALRTLGMGP